MYSSAKCELSSLSYDLSNAPSVFKKPPIKRSHLQPHYLLSLSQYHPSIVIGCCVLPKSKLHATLPSFQPHSTSSINQITMFTRRLVKSSSSLSTSIRAFSAGPAVFGRSPALADVTPQGVTSFDAKQKEFRERLAAQSKPVKKETSQSSSSQLPPFFYEAPTAPNVSNASTVSNICLGFQAHSAAPQTLSPKRVAR